jgi:hypothetical protein
MEYNEFERQLKENFTDEIVFLLNESPEDER